MLDPVLGAEPFIDGSNLYKMGRDMMASRILCDEKNDERNYLKNVGKR
jgi:hypothetical protein